MDQIKMGLFLKELRKDRDLTQEDLAEQLNISNRTVSRWETGSSIPELINGERKSEIMHQEVRDTAVAMSEYGQNEVKNGKKKIIGVLIAVFGLFIIVSALMIFPSESSWGSIYAILGSVLLVIGLYFIVRPLIAKRSVRSLTIACCVLFIFGAFAISDYIVVKCFNQVPRFRYESTYEFDSGNSERIVHKTLFFTAIQKNPGTEKEFIYLF